MQTVVQVICSRGRSLRQRIAKDRQLREFELVVSEQKRHGRPNGWTKVHSTKSDRHGALNIEWDSDTHVLLCRVITRRDGRSSPIVGDFVDYLLRRHSQRIIALNIIPP